MKKKLHLVSFFLKTARNFVSLGQRVDIIALDVLRPSGAMVLLIIFLPIRYFVENFPCFPTVYNIPRVIFNGFQDILLETRLGRESLFDFPV